MSTNIRSLSPAPLWNNFADLNAIPRASKKEQRVIEFAKSFGEKLGLPTHVDAIGNVIIKKPATPGMEKRMTVALQGHLDMVHQKNSATQFNFDTQGIDMLVEGDWVRANGTTLGADNGIGVAAIMTLLASKDIAHPPLEALFTIDEETGMTGALGLKGGLLNAKVMLNLDTEDDRELTIGCAGGVDVTATGTYAEESAPAGNAGFRIQVKGLTGGHSGMDIHKGRGNANKIMNRILSVIADAFDIRIGSVDGGSLRNAIPRESVVHLAIPAAQKDALNKMVRDLAATVKKENHSTDPNLAIEIQDADTPARVAGAAIMKSFLRSVYACPNGIYRMSPEIKDLVQTSNNIARILLKDGTYTIQCLTRSAVDSEKMDLAQSIKSCFELIGANVTYAGSYPGWAPAPESSIVRLMSGLYTERFKAVPLVNACHAGLECGIIGANYPETEMISFGPNIHGAHSPDEKVQVSSVQKFWDFLLETLKRIPEAN